jgi:hypothetical protein
MTLSKRAALIACLFGLGNGLAAAQQDKKEITPAEVRKAIAVFQEKPASPEGKAASKQILVFAAQSKDVVVILGKEETGWLGMDKEKKEENTGHLMVAYVAGSVLSQLDSKKATHDMYASMQQVFRTYQQLQKQDKDFKRPDLDKLMAMDKEGKLKKHVADIQEKRGDRKLDK